MKKIKIFLASSNELKFDREQLEIEINRKNKVWVNKNYFFHLEIWEDLPASMSTTRSQDEYNEKIIDSDIFILLAYSKVGMFTEEEFEIAFGQFKEAKKPFIFTYFKDNVSENSISLDNFKNKLKNLGHFYSTYSSQDNLWNQINKELDRLFIDDFTLNRFQTILDKNLKPNIKNQFNNGTFNNSTFN